MSERKVVIIAPLKSALIGFVLNLLGFGFFGIDRFYKGDTLLGFVKLVSGINGIIMMLPAVGLVGYVLDTNSSFLDIINSLSETIMSGNADSSIVIVVFCVLAVFHLFVWSFGFHTRATWHFKGQCQKTLTNQIKLNLGLNFKRGLGVNLCFLM